jgi:hypothetical protein
MDPRMQAREWFMDKPGTNKYDIEVHVQRSFWHSGFGQAFFRCTSAEPPYACEGFWRGQELEFEWVPRQWLALYLREFDNDVVDAFSRVMRLEPSLRYTLVSSPDEDVPDTGSEAVAAESDGTESEEAADGEPDAGFTERVVVEWRVGETDNRVAELNASAGIHAVEPM